MLEYWFFVLSLASHLLVFLSHFLLDLQHLLSILQYHIIIDIYFYILLKFRDIKLNLLIQITYIIAKWFFLCLGQVFHHLQVTQHTWKPLDLSKTSLHTFQSTQTLTIGASLPFPYISISIPLGSPRSPPQSDLVTLEVRDLHRGDIGCRIPNLQHLLRGWVGIFPTYNLRYKNSNSISNNSASNFQSHTATRLATLAAIYSTSDVLSATDIFFLLNHEIMPNPRLKQHLEVLF